MNIYDEIESFFAAKDLDYFSKIRYIYLYVCDKFSYDTRFMYARPGLKNEIYNLIIDPQNVEEYEIVCYTYAKLLEDILTHFGFDCHLIREDSRSIGKHAYVIVKVKDRIIKLDPTKKHDTTRVKMHLGTYDFVALTDDPTFEEDLQYADSIIYDSKERAINKERLNNFMNSILELDNDTSKPPANRFFNKLNLIFELVNNKKDFKRYDDIDYYFSYLLKRSRINTHGTFVKPAIFFRNDDPSMKSIINIILVDYPDTPTVFYILEKEKDHYHIRPIESKEVLEKLEEYDNWTVYEYFKNKAKEANYKLL